MAENDESTTTTTTEASKVEDNTSKPNAPVSKGSKAKESPDLVHGSKDVTAAVEDAKSSALANHDADVARSKKANS